MADVSHVYADLVSTAGFQAQAQAGVRTEVFHNAVVRHRRFTHRVHRHVGALGRVTRDRLFYRAAGGHGADRHRFVFTGNFTRLQRFHQPGLRRHGFATTIRPVVSLSRRCTMPARGTSAISG